MRADRHFGQGEDESGGCIRVQAPAQGGSRDGGDGALELRERAKRAPVFGDRRELGRPACRARDRFQVRNLRALERRRQHRVGTGGTDRIDGIPGGLGRHPPETTRREQDHRVPATLIVFAALEDLLAQPGEINRLVSVQCDAGVFARRFRTAVIGLVEDDVPEAARARDRWLTDGVHGETGDEHRGIECRSAEGALLEHATAQHPLKDRVQTTRGFHTRGNVGRIEVESDPQLLRRQLRDGAKERREPALAGRHERAHEFGRLIGALIDERLPDRLRGWTTRNVHASRSDAQAGSSGEKRDGVSGRELGNQLRLTCKPRSRIVVQRQQANVEERRAARLHDGADKSLRGRTAGEHCAGPQLGREGQRKLVDRSGSGGGTVQLVDEGLDRALASVLPLAERHVVGAADELQEELRAVGRAFITDSGQRGPEPSGQGHLGESARLVGAPGARRADEHDRTDEDGVEYGKTPSADQGPPCSPLFCTSGGKKRS